MHALGTSTKTPPLLESCRQASVPASFGAIRRTQSSIRIRYMSFLPSAALIQDPDIVKRSIDTSTWFSFERSANTRNRD